MTTKRKRYVIPLDGFVVVQRKGEGRYNAYVDEKTPAYYEIRRALSHDHEQDSIYIGGIGELVVTGTALVRGLDPGVHGYRLRMVKKPRSRAFSTRGRERTESPDREVLGRAAYEAFRKRKEAARAAAPQIVPTEDGKDLRVLVEEMKYGSTETHRLPVEAEVRPIKPYTSYIWNQASLLGGEQFETFEECRLSAEQHGRTSQRVYIQLIVPKQPHFKTEKLVEGMLLDWDKWNRLVPAHTLPTVVIDHEP